MLGHNTKLFTTQPTCGFNLGCTLISEIINSGKFFPLTVQGCGVAITPGG